MNLTQEQELRINVLLSQMTIEEKVGQLNQVTPSIVGGFEVPFSELIEMMIDGRISKEEFSKIMSSATQDYHEEDIRNGFVSSMILQNPEKSNELQRIAVEESRLGIPLLFGFDVIHGYHTVFPIALAEAGSFEESLFERTARMAALESRAKGISWHFAPMLDIARDARWGRVSEGPGADAYLASVFGRAKVKGLQDDRSSTENYVAACLKHFVAYGACESGRDYNTTTMANSLLHNVYLPPFKAAVEAGAATVMASFNDLNGIPCTVNSYVLQSILKEAYGFQGFVVSDAGAIKECMTHGISQEEEEVSVMALQAGLDMDMGTSFYKDNLVEAVKKGILAEEVIHEAARRVLSVKMWLGLFENPYISEEQFHRYDELPKEHIALAREAAQKSIVLLKNDGTLPLDRTKKISLVGELANMPEEVVGAWAMSWRRDDCISIKEGLENAGAELVYYEGCGPKGDLNRDEIQQACENGDLILAVVGEYVSASGEASSMAEITLPGKQREMLEMLLVSGKPVVTILMNGRPLALGWEKENLPVLVECWHLGIQMGNAVADVLFGDYHPSAKLATTIPYATGQCPIYHDHPNTGRPGSKSKFTSRYLDVPHTPAFPFGYGLSYTTFEYSDLVVEDCGDSLKVQVVLTNTGAKAGEETVQLYLRDMAASIVRPVKELKGFVKVALEVGASEKVGMMLKKSEMGFYHDDMSYRLEDGNYVIYVGGDSENCLEKTMYVNFDR